MNKTININLGGLFFHIDEIAFEKLNRYLDAISRSLSDDPQGKDEIISDIEARISELLSEKIKDVRQVVNENDIEEIIAIMGQPEDYSDGEETYSESSSYRTRSRNTKKLYRDGDDKFLGGVCAGLGHFLGVDSIWIRLAFIILTASGFPVFIYIILWILLPEAKTTSEKLQMEGEQVNIGNIEKKIRDEFESLSLRLKDGANELSDKISSADYDKLKYQTKSGLQDLIDTLGRIFSVFFKVFGKFLGGLILFIAGVTLISLFLGAFSVGSIEILNFDNNFISYPPFFYDSILPKWLLTLCLFLLIGIPFLALFILGLRILSPNVKRLNTPTSLTLLGVWLLALFGTVFAGIEFGMSRAYEGTKVTTENINYTINEPLKISVKNDNNIYYLNKLRRRDNSVEVEIDSEKKKYSNNVKINVEKSETEEAYIEVKKETQGRKRALAYESAGEIDYNFDIIDNKLIFDAYFLSDYKNMWKDEEVELTLFVPENTVIYFENSSKRFLYDIDNTEDIYDQKMANHHFKMTTNGFECTDCKTTEKNNDTEVKDDKNNYDYTFLFDSTINNAKAEFIISKNTTKKELEKLINWFKNKKNIDINIIESSFKNSKINQLTLDIDCNDGYEGKIIINKNTLEDISKGFVRRYNDDDIPFKTW